MRHLFSGLRVALALLVLPIVGFAQEPTVEAGFINRAGLDVFFLKDFDINRPGNGPPIFYVEIRNNNVPRNSDPASGPRLILEMLISSREHGNLSRGQTGPLSFNPDQRVRLTNNDLFTSNGPYRFRDYQIDDAVVSRLLEDILATGRLPSDIYKFDVRLRSEDGGPIDNADDSFDIRVRNPRRLDLVFPGAPASGRRSDCQAVFTNLPQFRWESDLRLFRVIVAEARRGEDPESILNQRPRFVRNYFIQGSAQRNRLPDLNFAELDGRVEVLPSTNFQYPASGTELALRPGKTYLWRVIGFISSSSGLIPLESEIFCFRVPRVDRFSAMQQQVEMLLRNMMGPELEKLFSEGGDLEGYDATRVTFNGKEVTVPELLIKMRKMDAKYSGYRIE